MSAVASQRKAPQAKAHCGAYRVPSKLPKKSRQWAGVFQGSCRVDRVFYAASSSAGCSRSGLSMTAPMGSQLRVLP
ncbi:hypothetical protein, partial [Pseudomonas aeruginosa]